MKITDISKNKKAAGYAVFIDGEFAFSLSMDYIVLNHLKKDMEISEEERERLLFLSVYIKAREKALRLLDMRAHSVRELQTKVSVKYGKEAAEKVSEDLLSCGLLNDRDFALRYAEELKRTKHFGAQRIKTELFRKGIPSEYVSEAVNALDDGDKSPAEIIKDDILRKHIGKMETEKGRRTLTAYFIRRGYTFRDVKEAFQMLELEISEFPEEF